MSTHIVSARIYLTIFAALMVLTAITVAVAFLDLGYMNNVAALGIATVKAILVILFFMHVRYSTKLTWLTVFGGFFWLTLFLGLTLSDYASRGWLGVPGK